MVIEKYDVTLSSGKYLMIMERSLQKEFLKLIDSMDIRESLLDYAVASRHIASLSSSPYYKTKAVTIFDNCRKTHIYESELHRRMFSDSKGIYQEMKIHPDDAPTVIKNAISTLRHVYASGSPLSRCHLIRQYRVLVGGMWKRIIEGMQVIETDSRGNPWLAMSIVTLSPDQEAPFIVRSILVDNETGDTFTPLDDFFDRDRILTPREIEILKNIAKGHLSKEIAAMLGLSVHTVNTHRQKILAKLKVSNSMEAIKYAEALGLLN